MSELLFGESEIILITFGTATKTSEVKKLLSDFSAKTSY